VGADEEKASELADSIRQAMMNEEGPRPFGGLLDDAPVGVGVEHVVSIALEACGSLYAAQQTLAIAFSTVDELLERMGIQPGADCGMAYRLRVELGELRSGFLEGSSEGAATAMRVRTAVDRAKRVRGRNVSDDGDWLRISDAARILHKSRGTISRWADADRIHDNGRKGRDRRVSRGDVLRIQREARHDDDGGYSMGVR
jgi:hypothetical protein